MGNDDYWMQAEIDYVRTMEAQVLPQYRCACCDTDIEYDLDDENWEPEPDALCGGCEVCHCGNWVIKGEECDHE